jgi:hypothetical protein
MAIVEIAGEDGSVLRIEVPDAVGDDKADFWAGRDTRGVVKQAAKAGTAITRQIYGEAIEMACVLAKQTWQRVASMQDERPDEFELTCALSVDTEVGAKVVTIDSGAQVQVRMQWNRRAQ